MNSTLFDFSQVPNYVSNNHTYEPYDLQKYAEDPFQIAQITTESIHDQKIKITKWLRQMSLAQKIQAITFTNKQFVTLIRQMFIQNEQKQFVYGISLNHSGQYELQFRLVQQKLKPISIDFSRKQNTQQTVVGQPIKYQDTLNIQIAQQKLIEQLRIMSKYVRYDSITFSESALLNLSDLLTTFDILQDGISQQMSFEQYLDIKKQITEKKQNHLIFFDHKDINYKCIMKSVYSWIVTAIKRNLSLKYYRTIQNYLNTSPTVIDIKNTHNQLIESSYDYKTLKNSFQNYWKQHSSNAPQLLKKVYKMNISQLVGEYRSILKVHTNSFPNIYCSSQAHQKNFQQEFINANPKQILQFLILDTIEHTFDSSNFLKHQLMHLIQTDIHKVENQKAKKKKKRKKSGQDYEKDRIQRSTSMKQEIKQNQQQNLILEDQGQFRTQNNDYPLDLQESQRSQSINLNQPQNLQQIVQKQQRQLFEKPEKKKKRKNKKKGVIILQTKTKNNMIQVQLGSKKSFHQDKSSKQSQTTNLTKQEQKKNILQHKRPTVQIKKQEQVICIKKNQNAKSLKINEQQIKNISRLIHPVSSNLNQTILAMKKKCFLMQQPRLIILKKIEAILFSNHLSYRLYGSSALQQQVLLPSSDLDISVDPTIIHYFYTQFCSYRDKIIKGLQYLAEVLKSLKWTSQVTVRKNAAVPLLNFLAYPYLSFDHVNEITLNSSLSISQLKKLQINVDITIDSFANMYQQVTPHKGYEATLFMRQWLNFYHHGELSYLVLLSKQLLFRNKLNKPFTGGIGAFTVFIIALAFLRSRSDLVCQQQQIFDIKREKQRLIIKAQSSKIVKKQQINIQIKRQKQQDFNKRKKPKQQQNVAKPLKINIEYSSPNSSPQTESPTNKSSSLNISPVSSVCQKTVVVKSFSPMKKKVKIIRNLDELFINFCAFVQGFDYSTYGIDIMKQSCASFKLKPLIMFCHSLGNSKSQHVNIPKKLVVLSPLNGQNLTQNCYQFDKIQKLFGRVSEVCMIQNSQMRKKQLNNIFFGQYQLLLEQYQHQMLKFSKDINNYLKQYL